MKDSLKNQKESLSSWINCIRKEVDCDTNPAHIKTWEFLLLIGISYSKEILDALITSFSSINNLSSLFTVYPFNLDFVWVLILKLGLGYIFLLYFQFKYHSTQTLWLIFIYWLFCVGYTSLDHLIKGDLLFISGFLKLLIQLLFFVYFFAIDPVHLDSLKILIYDNLEINALTGRVKKTYESKLSGEKIRNLTVSILLITLVSMVILSMLSWLISIFKSAPTSKPSNQKTIESAAKEHLISIMITSCFAAPIIEELIFRRCIMKLGNFRWWTIPASGFVFGLVHLHQDSFKFIIPYIIPGLIFSTVFYVSRNIWHCILSHSLYNLITFIYMIIDWRTN